MITTLIRSGLGLGAMGFILWLWGGSRSLAWRKLLTLTSVHMALAAAVFKIPHVTSTIAWMGGALHCLNTSVCQGTSFVFGYLGGAPLPFDSIQSSGTPYVLMFQALPVLIVTGALTVVLFYWGIIPRLVIFLSRFMQKFTGFGGALSTGLVTKVFLGQTEVPLVLRPYVAVMSSHEIIVLMMAGMSTSAWATFAPYSQMLSSILPSSTTMVHLIGGTLLNIIASLIVAELVDPCQGESTPGDCIQPHQHDSLVQAITQGALEGGRIMLMIGAVMLAFVSLTDVANNVLQWMFSWTGHSVSLIGTASTLLTPVMWLLGITWHEASMLAHLMAQKLLINEWVAFQFMAKQYTGGPNLSILAIYLLGSFGNISSMGIQTACYGAFAPQRVKAMATWVPKAFVGSVVANIYTATIVRYFLLF